MIDIWDTAGQDVFDKMHPAYYFEANAALLVFDTTRKITYKNCMKWYNEFRSHCPSTPCILVGNKIDIDKRCTQRKYALAEKLKCPFYLVSAADGTNVVRIFEELIKIGVEHKINKIIMNKLWIFLMRMICLISKFYCFNFKLFLCIGKNLINYFFSSWKLA